MNGATDQDTVSNVSKFNVVAYLHLGGAVAHVQSCFNVFCD